MPVRSYSSGYREFAIFRGPAMRTGVYVGAIFSLILTAWLFVANRMPALEGFALERNAAAAVALGFFGLIPILRFHREPGRLWASGATACLLVSLTYWLLSLFFTGLAERYSAFQVFMIGAVAYTIVSTICWIATVLWRMRAPHATPGGVSDTHASPSNHRMS